MSDNSRLSLLALIVALLALVIALGQLAQQVFGTADGYRSCQQSVIGRSWARHTKLSWRWSQFRFETKFATPDIRVYRASIGEGYSPVFSGFNATPEYCSESTDNAVSWNRFLTAIHNSEKWKHPWTGSEMFPKVRKNEARWEEYCALKSVRRSWDLMPPEMVLPLATSRLGDIVVLAHRLGMRWRDISHRELLADGNGQVMSSTEARGLGLILKYDRIGNINPTDESIPCVANDKLRCGILPGWRLPCFDDYQSDLQLIDNDGKPVLLLNHLSWATQMTRDLLEVMRTPAWDRFKRYRSTLYDWISLNCDFLPLPDWSHRRIVWPIAEDEIKSQLASPECWILLGQE